MHLIEDYLFKFLIIGSAGIGKSCILHQFIESKCKVFLNQVIDINKELGFQKKTVFFLQIKRTLHIQLASNSEAKSSRSIIRQSNFKSGIFRFNF